jgi:hypothetical protein
MTKDWATRNRIYQFWLLFITACIFLSSPTDCAAQKPRTEKNPPTQFYPSSKPCTRWWWFATEIQKPDIRYQLDWLKANNFGGVEVAWVYPLHRYQTMYAKSYGRHYPEDTTAQAWLGPEWQDVVTYTKRYADSIGLACDFTFGSA